MSEMHFQFHPVGQGLFYSGQVGEFDFVYDCGTASGISHVKSAVEAYDRFRRRKTSKGKLGLLILSHFHEDHINGVGELLAKTGGVSEVVLPYLYPAERLMVAAEFAVANQIEDLGDEHIEFLADPAKFLRDRGADRVTFIPPGGPVAEWPAFDPEIGEGEGRWVPNNKKLEPKDRGDDPALGGDGGSLRSHESVYLSPQVAGNFRPQPKSSWQFKFYCREHSRVSCKDIETALANRGLPTEPGKIAATIRDNLETLKEIYYELFGGPGGQNFTSLVCCHGPVEVPAQAASWGNPFPSPPPQQLLLGDAEIEVKVFETHYEQELPRVGLTLLPHHGSSRSWRHGFLKAMPYCRYWVASSGRRNRYRHPSEKVVRAVQQGGRQFVLCHEHSEVAVQVCQGRHLIMDIPQAGSFCISDRAVLLAFRYPHPTRVFLHL